MDISPEAPAAPAEGSSSGETDTEATNTTTVLRNFGIKEVQGGVSPFPKDYYSLTDGKHVARAYKIWGTTIKVVCHTHRACSIMYLEAWCGEAGAMPMAYCWIAAQPLARRTPTGLSPGA